MARYKGRSAAFFAVLTEGLPDEHGDLHPLTKREAELSEWAHERLGRAIEDEVWDAQPEGLAGQGSASVDVQGSREADPEC